MTHICSPRRCTQILHVDINGQKQYEDYVAKHKYDKVSLWAPTNQQNNDMFMSRNKQQTRKVCKQTTDLKKNKELFGRFIYISCKIKSAKIDQKNAVGNNELTLTPRTLFTPDELFAKC